MSSPPDPSDPPSSKPKSKLRGPYKPRMKSGEPTIKLILRSKKDDLIGKSIKAAKKLGIKPAPKEFYVPEMPDRKRPCVPLKDKTEKERLYYFNRLKADELKKIKAEEDAKLELLKDNPIMKRLMQNPTSPTQNFQLGASMIHETCSTLLQAYCPVQIESRWGFEIEQLHPLAVTCPLNVEATIKELNEKQKWNHDEKVSVYKFMNAIRAHICLSSTNALWSTMKDLYPFMKNLKSTSTTHVIPSLQLVVENYMSKFIGNINSFKELPNLVCSQKLDNIPENDDKLEIHTPGKVLQSTSEAVNLGSKEIETVIYSAAIITKVVQQLKMRNPAEKWGVVGGVQLSVEDILEMLTADYSDTVMDAEGSRLFEDTPTNADSPSVVYFPLWLSQLFKNNNFESDSFQTTFDCIRKCNQTSTILIPFHNSDAMDHWIMAIVTLCDHPTFPAQINFFDPLKIDGTLNERLSKNETGVKNTINFLRKIRDMMTHLFPRQKQWRSFDNPWPKELEMMDIPGIPSQGFTRECGPVLILVMQLYANLPPFSGTPLRNKITAKGWKQIRFAHYIAFNNAKT